MSISLSKHGPPSTNKSSVGDNDEDSCYTYWTPTREARLSALWTAKTKYFSVPEKFFPGRTEQEIRNKVAQMGLKRRGALPSIGATGKRKEREEAFQGNKKKVAKTKSNDSTQPTNETSKDISISTSIQDGSPAGGLLNPPAGSAHQGDFGASSSSSSKKKQILWTLQETELLRAAWTSQKRFFPVDEIQRNFLPNRSQSTIKDKASSMNLQRGMVRSNFTWTQEEETKLRAVWTSQIRYLPVAEIQKSFLPHRSRSAIAEKVRSMNLRRDMAGGIVRWTQEEDHKLRELWTSKTTYYTPREITSFLPGRSATAISYRARGMHLERDWKFRRNPPSKRAMKRTEQENSSQENEVVKTNSNAQTERPINKKLKAINEDGFASPGEKTPSPSGDSWPPTMGTASLQASSLRVASSEDSSPVGKPAAEISAPERAAAPTEQGDSSMGAGWMNDLITSLDIKAIGLECLLVILWTYLGAHA